MQHFKDDAWPKWESDSRFSTPSFDFVSSWSERRFPANLIPIHKPRQFFTFYRELISKPAIRGIVEVGYLHGGMPLFLADLLPDAKVVGIDINPPNDFVTSTIEKCGLSDRVKFYSGVSQDDGKRVREILDLEFCGEPLDMIMDDASHLYAETKETFESCFGYLKDGGVYVIEDWGWAHWRGSDWQSPNGRFAGKTPLTKLLFELTMLLGSRSDICSRITIPHGALAIVTKGNGLTPKARIDIEDEYMTAGHKFVGFTS